MGRFTDNEQEHLNYMQKALLEALVEEAQKIHDELKKEFMQKFESELQTLVGQVAFSTLKHYDIGYAQNQILIRVRNDFLTKTK